MTSVDFQRQGSGPEPGVPRTSRALSNWAAHQGMTLAVADRFKDDENAMLDRAVTAEIDWAKEFADDYVPPDANSEAVYRAEQERNDLLLQMQQEKDEILRESERERSVLLQQADAEKAKIIEQDRLERERLEALINESLKQKQTQLLAIQEEASKSRNQLQELQARLQNASAEAESRQKDSAQAAAAAEAQLQLALDQREEMLKRGVGTSELAQALQEKNKQIEELKRSTEDAKIKAKQAHEAAEVLIRKQQEEIDQLNVEVNRLYADAAKRSDELAQLEALKIRQTATSQANRDRVCVVDANGDRQCHYTRCLVM